MSQTKAQLVSGTTAQNLTVDNINTSSINDAQTSGRKNIIINGAMAVAQRGTSFSSANITNSFPVDRFKLEQGNSQADVYTITQNTNAARELGFENSLKVVTATPDSSLASGHFSQFRYNIEAQDFKRALYGTSNAKTLTLSFYVKSSQTGTFLVALNAPDGGRSNPQRYTINSANTWERKSITFAGDTESSAVYQTVAVNDRGFEVRFALAIGSQFQGGTAGGGWVADSGYNNLYTTYTGNLQVSNASWELTGVQLEVGSTATDFEHLTAVEDLSLCQRYTIAFDAKGSIDNFAPIGNGRFYNGTDAQILVHLPTTMRNPPTIEAVSTTAANTFFLNSDGGFGGHAMTSIALNERSFNSITFVAQSLGNISGQTVGLGTTVYADDGDDAKLVLTAEF